MKKTAVLCAALLAVASTCGKAIADAPVLGSYGDWLRLVSADTTTGMINGTQYGTVATYTIFFDAYNTRDARNGSAHNNEPGWMFCGYKVSFNSQFGGNRLAVWVDDVRGIHWQANVNWEGGTQASVEGNLHLRYVLLQPGEPMPVCESDGYSVQNASFEKGQWMLDKKETCGCFRGTYQCNMETRPGACPDPYNNLE